MPIISTSRLNMHYRSHGAPAKPGHAGLTLLLLHGSFGTSRWWDPFLALLPEELHALAPDLRGCGQSDKPGSGYAIAEQAADLAAFAEALALDGFDLVAHASSAAIAVEYVLAHPAAARTLTLVNPVPVEGAFTPLEGLALLDQMRADPDLLRSAMTLLAPRLAAAGDPLFDQIVADAAQMDPAAFADVAAALNQWNRFGQAKQITLPTLLLWGEGDPFVSREAMTRTLIAIPGANTLEVLPAEGHAPMLEAPLLLAERLFDFLDSDIDSFAALRGRA